jgi:beta-N-acetylhexosaminidase
MGQAVFWNRPYKLYTFLYSEIHKILLLTSRAVLFAVLLIAGALCACSGKTETLASAPPSKQITGSFNPLSPLTKESLAEVEERAKSLNRDQKVGQLFIIHLPWTHDGSKITHLTQAEKNAIRDIQPGGVVLYGVHIATLEQVRTLASEIAALCIIPPFIAVDEEGGRVSRLNNLSSPRATRVPAAAVLARAGPYAVKTAYTVIGRELSLAGINMDFAPVADVPFGTDSDIIGDRALGASFNEAAAYVALATQALSREGVVPVLKHFPGHGRSQGDTHEGVQIIDASWDEMLETDIIPFKRAFSIGAPALMTAHISYPKIEEEALPASISSSIITGKLRTELGFDGVVITDALDMQGIIAASGGKDSAVRALEAGVDMLLSPDDPLRIRRAINEALENGSLDPILIEQALLRILKLKKQFRILDGWTPWPDYRHAVRIFGSGTAQRVLSEALSGKTGFVNR